MTLQLSMPVFFYTSITDGTCHEGTACGAWHFILEMDKFTLTHQIIDD